MQTLVELRNQFLKGVADSLYRERVARIFETGACQKCDFTQGVGFESFGRCPIIEDFVEPWPELEEIPCDLFEADSPLFSQTDSKRLDEVSGQFIDTDSGQSVYAILSALDGYCEACDDEIDGDYLTALRRQQFTRVK